MERRRRRVVPARRSNLLTVAGQRRTSTGFAAYPPSTRGAEDRHVCSVREPTTPQWSPRPREHTKGRSPDEVLRWARMWR